MDRTDLYRYEFTAAGERPPWHLRSCKLDADDRRFPFAVRIELGRYQDGRDGAPGVLLIDDATVSRRHCILTRTADARCLLRDTSRNGTWVDGRRCVPGIEVELQHGQIINLGNDHIFEFEGDSATSDDESSSSGLGTISFTSTAMVTVLVGDIRGYTQLVQKAPSHDLQRGVSRVFQRLERHVAALGGTIKEYPGDAIFAFWERRSDVNQAAAACRAALALDELSTRLAADPSVWDLDGFPLKMDWALATGPVVIRSQGGSRPTGLSMVGEPVVLAFRIEKMADDRTGTIVACERTVAMIGGAFRTRELGLVDAKGFESSRRIFAILGEDEAPPTIEEAR